jgi:hypothetical protein
MATFKERVIQKAKDVAKQLAERELSLEKEKKFQCQYRNDVFTAIHKELKDLNNLTVHTNQPFKVDLNLVDHTINTPCGKLSYIPIAQVDTYYFVDCDGKRTEVKISYQLESKSSEIETLLLLFENCIVKHLRIVN